MNIKRKIKEGENDDVKRKLQLVEKFEETENL